MAKKNQNEPGPAPKKRLEVACQHASCVGQAHGTIAVECEPWEVAAYLLVHHFNHEGHKTEVRIDGLEYHRLAPVPAPAPAVAPAPAEEPATAPSFFAPPATWQRW
jgi:hypothetical protein